MFVKIMTKIIKLCKTFLSEEYISDLEYHKYIESFTVENRPLILITLILRKNHQCRRIPHVLKSAPKIIKIKNNSKSRAGDIRKDERRVFFCQRGFQRFLAIL